MIKKTSLSMAVVLGCSLLAACGGSGGSDSASNAVSDTQYELSTGKNPHPVKLLRPKAAPLSAMALLGKQVFYDKNLSGSGQMSCATCHDPQNFYGPPGNASVVLGGPKMQSQGARAVPSLMYLDRDPPFSIGPDNPANEGANRQGGLTNGGSSQKTANNTGTSANNMVPQGGMFWDGRVNTLQQQASGPLFNPVEMDGGSVQIVAAKLEQAAYAQSFVDLFGNNIFNDPKLLVSEALFAVARYEVEEPSFHPYSSKYDAWLEGKAKFSDAEMRGYLLFNNPDKANCAACHLDRPTTDNQPPLFTDHQYEALGVPRNPAIDANGNPSHFDLGLCGPFRTDLAKQTQYCGMFLTPTLRNVATRKVFFHNGYYHTLIDVLKFYDYRDAAPARIYPVSSNGKVEKFNDLPSGYQVNVDTVDSPFNRKLGDQPAMTQQDMQDMIAFLKTLTDGYYDPSKP